jgi:predicted DNA-binding transcriptional regulator YafY
MKVILKKGYKRAIYLDDLIRKKATGPPKTLAKKLNVSEATVYRYLNVLKEKGAPIAYSRLKMTYYYYQDFELTLG